MLKKLWGIKFEPGKRLKFYVLFMPVIKIKGTRNSTYRVYFLGIPLFSMSEHTFHDKVSAFAMLGNGRKYLTRMIQQNSEPSNEFVPITEQPHTPDSADPKLLAFYLPQFHAIPLNDANYGRGFTEWTNVTRAIPSFAGHYQPRLPIDVGFYNLDRDDVMFRQIELAKMYGLHGFCFYYYWFSGTRLLEKPIFNYLRNDNLDFPFCLTWANENWSKLWDGGDKQVIAENKHDVDDSERFFNDILPFLQDKRYITINGRPLIGIYQPAAFPREILTSWVPNLRALAKAHGFPDLYLMAPYLDRKSKPEDFCLDAFYDFPPKYTECGHLNTEFVNWRAKATLYDIRDHIKYQTKLKTDFRLFPGLFPSWDNTARKAYTGAHIYPVSPVQYKEWLQNSIHAAKTVPQEEQFVFINAWNEWAEGAHLEPDIKYGYAYLQATKEALEEAK